MTTTASDDSRILLREIPASKIRLFSNLKGIMTKEMTSIWEVGVDCGGNESVEEYEPSPTWCEVKDSLILDIVTNYRTKCDTSLSGQITYYQNSVIAR